MTLTDLAVPVPLRDSPILHSLLLDHSITGAALLPEGSDTVTADPIAWGLSGQLPRVTLARDLPGLPSLRHFVLVPLGEEGLLLGLRSLDADDLLFVVVPSVGFFPEYAPEVDAATLDALGLDDASDALVLLIVTVGSSLRTSTANLRAPLLLNRRTLAGAQAALTEEYPVRAALIDG